MKLENLLAPYLHQYKKLNLPGIGTFEVVGTTPIQDESAKSPIASQNVRFIQNSISQPDDEFINYIKAHTGKMKPLAMADLESYLMLTKQFLNIGKPVQIEGIGILQKMQDGAFQFSSEEYPTLRAENTSPENSKPAIKKKTLQEDKTAEETSRSGRQKALLVLTIIATIALIGWGGYYLYETNANRETGDATINSITSIANNSVEQQPISPDSSLLIKDTLKTADTAAMASSTAPVLPGNIKFILETTANKKRALYRFTYVNKISRRIQLETKPDSSLFKIFVVLPAAMSDTGRIKDSLNAWYYGKREMKIRIE